MMERLTAEKFRQAGRTLYGRGPGWQSRLAEGLGVDRSSVTRWLAGLVPIPQHISTLTRYYLIFGTPDLVLSPKSLKKPLRRKPHMQDQSIEGLETWLECALEEDIDRAKRLPATGSYKVEMLWAWIGSDQTDELSFSTEAAPGETIAVIVERLNKMYVDKCQELGATPRQYYFEGMSGKDVMVGT